MTTTHQKFKIKPIDVWSIREQLCLASSVLRSGDQNWSSVSRSLRSFVESNRPADWLSPKYCALQYNSLLEKAGAHKRKRGERHPSSGSTDSQQGETAGEIILKQLTQERIEELQQIIESCKNEYQIHKHELQLLREQKIDEKLPEIYKKIEEENHNKLRDKEAYAKWLEVRERKKQELQQQLLLRGSRSGAIKEGSNITSPDLMEGGVNSLSEQLSLDIIHDDQIELMTDVKNSSTPTNTAVQPTTPSSPLLTSLLRSPTTPSSTPTSSKVSTVAAKLSFTLGSPSGLSSGLKNLLSSAIGDDSSIKPNTSPVTGGVAPTLTRLLELPLNTPGKPLPELPSTEAVEDKATVDMKDKELILKETCIEDAVVEESVEIRTTKLESEGIPDVIEENIEIHPKSEVNITENVVVFSEHPTDVIEVASEGYKTCVPETCEVENVVQGEEIISHTKSSEVIDTLVEDKEQNIAVLESIQEIKVETISEDLDVAVETEVEACCEIKTEKNMEEILMGNDGQENISVNIIDRSNIPNKPRTEVNVSEEKSELKIVHSNEVEVTTKVESETPTLARRPLRSLRRKPPPPEIEVSFEEKNKTGETPPATRRSTGSRKTPFEETAEVETGEEVVTETSVSQIVPKKKNPTLPPPPPVIQAPLSSPAPSSGFDSMPNSPTSSVSTVTEDDRDYKAWKKSIMLVWREISSHKNASLFQKPISDDHAPGYRSTVLRPMDLSSIRKSIESGAMKTTVEFHRDVMLMFLNSIMFNPSNGEVFRMAKEMQNESNSTIQEYVSAQLLAQTSEHMRPHRRETRDSTRRTESLSSHEETPSKPEEGKTRAAVKRASAAAVVDEPKKRRSRAQND